ncbi:hypothetical protein V5G28_003305 [Scytonema sp. PRP1]
MKSQFLNSRHAPPDAITVSYAQVVLRHCPFDGKAIARAFLQRLCVA